MILKEKLQVLRGEGRAILATNFYNYETLRAVVSAVKRQGDPVILQLSESSIDYMGLETAVAMARSCIKAEGITAWLHLDHGKDTELAARCIEAGFDSVMIDGSHLPLEENIRITREVVELAGPAGICVEAELGYVAKLGQEQTFEYTTPAEAGMFVESTGIDALAIAIGSAHGFYKQEPKLALDVLRGIREVTPAALVLHGSSGIPGEQVQEAIRSGINKVNLATEIKDIFMGSLGRLLRDSREIDLRILFPGAIEEVSRLVEQKLNMVRDANPVAGHLHTTGS
jgi:tagatose 1,6-diphosphate aldolase GatY/KbaY